MSDKTKRPAAADPSGVAIPLTRVEFSNPTLIPGAEKVGHVTEFYPGTDARGFMGNANVRMPVAHLYPALGVVRVDDRCWPVNGGHIRSFDF